ncbi:MAG: cyclodeaminase/cyclohydrolase family protein [Chloroflexota bacterium]
MPDIERFLESLSSGEPIPGGGSVAALQTAMAASLLCMVANLTVGRKRYANVEEQVKGIREESSCLRDRAHTLIQEDSDAYGQVSQALGLPKQSDEEKAARQEAVQLALKGAVDPPLTTMRVAVEVLRLAGELAPIGNTSAASDVGTAALCARSGYASAALNVEINLQTIRDQEWVNAHRLQVRDLADAEALEQEVMERVKAIITGEGG